MVEEEQKTEVKSENKTEVLKSKKITAVFVKMTEDKKGNRIPIYRKIFENNNKYAFNNGKCYLTKIIGEPKDPVKTKPIKKGK